MVFDLCMCQINDTGVCVVIISWCRIPGKALHEGNIHSLLLRLVAAVPSVRFSSSRCCVPGLLVHEFRCLRNRIILNYVSPWSTFFFYHTAVRRSTTTYVRSTSVSLEGHTAPVDYRKECSFQHLPPILLWCRHFAVFSKHSGRPNFKVIPYGPLHE